MPPSFPIGPSSTATTHVAKRVIACLDVRSNDAGDLVVTKGDQYDVRERVRRRGRKWRRREGEHEVDDIHTMVPSSLLLLQLLRILLLRLQSEEAGRGAVRNLGKPVSLAKRYYDDGADEITFLNITSFRQVGKDNMS